jgi:subtilase family serine protease
LAVCPGCCRSCCDRPPGDGDDPGDGGGNAGPGGVSIDVEQIRERQVMTRQPPDDDGELADLLPIATGQPTNPNPLSAFCVRRNGQLVVTIRNQGVADAVPSTTTVSYPAVGVTSNRPTPVIAAGQNVEVLFPFPTTCGECIFTIIADSANPQDVAESNEANNQAQGFCAVAEG